MTKVCVCLSKVALGLHVYDNTGDWVMIKGISIGFCFNEHEHVVMSSDYDVIYLSLWGFHLAF